MTEREISPTLGRLILGAVGALAGLSFWGLVDVLPDLIERTEWPYLFLTSFTASFFIACLALIGPVPAARAAIASAGLGLVIATLLTWAGQRFEGVDAFMQTGHPLPIFFLLTFTPLPFFIAKIREGRWDDYSALFAHSWDIVVRYAAALLFVGIAWGVLMLSDAMLQLVGVTFIQQLLRIDVVPYVLVGTVLGVALAVVNELSEYVSPYLILRLLRLLLPAVLVVVSVFLVALPFKGLSNLFGTLSAAATLMAMAMGATTLVTTALDADGQSAVQGRVMRLLTQGLALVLPALGILAGVAIWLRVDQYGWTPDRLAAATLAALVLGYGASYAVAVILRRDWAERIRRINVVMALVVMAVGIAWLTPLLNPQRIATANQVARFEAGKVSAEKLDLWSIGREWGHAGVAGFEQLAEMQVHPDAALLAERIEKVKNTTSRYSWRDTENISAQGRLAEELQAVLPVLPVNVALPDGVLSAMGEWRLRMATEACGRTTPAGNPECLALVVELVRDNAGPEVVLFYVLSDGRLWSDMLSTRTNGDAYVVAPRMNGNFAVQSREGAEHLDALFSGEFETPSAGINYLDFAGQRLFFAP
ncbi:DUF4153 domain-containing protein [Actibacterium lipolyticum]|uniref:DUF4153 domain-containing protein n=1 Tax=Actibacterium lipolyticum TaxID=1524263 RepID=A0A238JRA6_9RHOB|nr:DUF4153 domain-containing protein [Actibacterium lipolyticum]SMX33179.1 hypothetical protein COL8621_00974 [Actibacterium lipolyticum]